jgi:ABC-type nickel/cobalt efflux system permease component RcnA
VCELVQARDLTPVAIGLSLLAAAFIGALHAVSPGHGKTVMAAYLVGAGGGGLRHAVGLGLTVTVSHTIGVLALGAITTYASSFLPPDKLQLFLSVASGAILLALGVYLVSSRVRELRRRPRTDRPRHAPAAPLRLATAGSGLRLSGIAPSAAVASPSVAGPIARGGAQADGHTRAGGHGHEHADGHDHPHDHGDDHAHDHAESHTDDGHAHDHADAHGHADAKDHADAHEHDHADGHTHDGHGHDDHGHGHADDHAHGHADDHAHDHADGQPHDHPHAGDVDVERSDAERGYHSHGLFRHTHLPEKLPDGALSWRALFALGLSGGLVPSASAVIVLLVSISLGRPGYGVLLTIAFGLGMAVVLIGIGVALVYARGLLERVPSRARFASVARWVPLATALFVLAVGVAITTQALVQLG